ncbi:thioredoxin-like domain-containing protein [Podospora didyma]|uniref:Protein disulfide-isomerase n=1 Tax=Podospora didyma TaxID=330526 RepID=A0AAE0NQ81_9PEZI|nr:thioredoxin-like domain-containing protein [Podospora didyma]
MKNWRAFFGLPVLLAGQALAWDHITEPGSLKAAIQANEHTLVACELSGTSHEKNQALETEWTKIQENEEGSQVVSVDCSQTPKACEELGVSSFPAIRLYHRDGRLDRYRGPRKTAAIQGYLRRALRPTVSHVTKKNETSFLLADDVVFVAYFAHSDSNLRERFAAVANKYRDRFSFGLSSDNDGKRQESILTCHNNPDQLQRSIAELSTADSLEGFVKLCATPLIPELTRRNEVSFYQSGKSLVHYFVHNDKQRDEYVTEIRPLAKKYEEYLHFTTTDADEYADAVAMMGLEPSVGGLSVQNPRNGDVFPYPGRQRLTAAVVEAFLVDIIQGRVQPWTGEHGQRGGQGGGGHDEL